MAGKRMLTSRLTADMITNDDVYTAEGQLLIPEKTVLTDAIIESLKERSIFAVRIQVKEDGKTPVLFSELSERPEEAAEPARREAAPQKEIKPKADVSPAKNETGTSGRVSFVAPVPSISGQEGTESYYEKVRETKEFKEFQSAFTETVDSLKDTLSQVVKGEEINTEEILKETENVVSKSRNSLHILDMLQCMRGYDDMTYMHCLNVAILSNLIGKVSNKKMPEEDLELLTLSGLLHDIGKIMIPDNILQKPERLTIPEYNLVKTHVLQGHNILKDRKLDKRVIDAVLRHHERMDGSGYPGGYRGDQVGDFSKILAIADTFDAMTSKRPYRDAICPFTVIAMFEREGITKYDLEYLLPFLHTVVQAYINTDVVLSNGEQGKVVLINKDSLSRPVVKVGAFYCDLVREPDVTIEKIIGM